MYRLRDPYVRNIIGRKVENLGISTLENYDTVRTSRWNKLNVICEGDDPEEKSTLTRNDNSRELAVPRRGIIIGDASFLALAKSIS